MMLDLDDAYNFFNFHYNVSKDKTEQLHNYIQTVKDSSIKEAQVFAKAVMSLIDQNNDSKITLQDVYQMNKPDTSRDGKLHCAEGMHRTNDCRHYFEDFPRLPRSLRINCPGCIEFVPLLQGQNESYWDRFGDISMAILSSILDDEMTNSDLSTVEAQKIGNTH